MQVSMIKLKQKLLEKKAKGRNMEVKITYLKKDYYKNQQSIPEIKKILKEKFTDLSNESFKVCLRQTEYKVCYELSKNENWTFLIISKNGETKENAEVLSKVIKEIAEGDIKKFYNIFQVYDGVSKYYCIQSFEILGELERRLRELIYNIMLKIYGIEWYKETFHEELKRKLKGNLKNNIDSYLIENALNELDYSDMIIYLFDERRFFSIDDMVDSSDSLENSLNKMNKEDIVSYIMQSKKTCIWNKCFSNIEIKISKKDLDDIRKYRNIVAHNKKLQYIEYQDNKQRAKCFINKVLKVTKDIDETRFNEKNRIAQLGDIALSFDETLGKVNGSNSVRELSKMTRKLLKSLYYKQSIQFLQLQKCSLKAASFSVKAPVPLINDETRRQIASLSVKAPFQLISNETKS